MSIGPKQKKDDYLNPKKGNIEGISEPVKIYTGQDC